MAEWVLSSCFLIAVVLLLRAALGKRISAALRYGLWAVVLVRLLVPVSFFTLPGDAPKIPAWTPPESMQEESIFILPVGSSPLEESGVQIMEDGRLGDPNSFGYPKLTHDGERVVRYADKISPLELLGWTWAAGAVAMACILLAANLRFSIRLRRVRKPLDGASTPIPVYVAPAVPSPCLVGLLHPAIYVTTETAATPAMLRHVLAHELTHYNHLDHLWSVLRGAALAVHWWNPLVWLAVVCSRRDSELACDEGALKHLGDSERAAYGETLLTLVTAKSKPGDLLTFATTMTGGKRSLKERIQRIAQQPKRLASAVAAVIIILSLTVLVAFGQGEEADDTDTPEPDTAPPASNVLSAAWENTDITLDENGMVHVIFKDDFRVEEITSNPVPAPREWAVLDDINGRADASTLIGSPDIWAQMVSTSDGWLVVTYGHGVAAADTYVYKTTDSGMNWTEVTMPGTNWYLSGVSFLSADRLLIAQRLFDGAPCVLTKDGGESWEEIELPDVQVLDISYSRGFLTMWIGQHEGEPATFRMTSTDLGDHWETASSEETYAADHPDDVWSPLADVLENLTPEDIGDISGQTSLTVAELADLLQTVSTRRTSRYHTYSSFEAEEVWTWSMGEWAVPLANGGTLHLIACDSGNLELSYETETEAVSAFYRRESTLHSIILRAGTLYSKVLPYEADLDRDGRPDELAVRSKSDDGMAWSLECSLSGGGTWEIEANTAHAGWNALFLCQLDGEDYLLQYVPYFAHMHGEYRYKLFYLEQKSAREVVVQENSVDFQINPTGSGIHEDPVFEDATPKEIADFMDEINALLANSTQLLNTDGYLQTVFANEGRLYDSMIFLQETWEKDKTLLENLLIYRNVTIAEGAIDGTWIHHIKEEDILTAVREDGTPVSKARLAEIIHSGEIGSTYKEKEDWEPEYPAIKVTYTSPGDTGEQTLVLQAGTSEGKKYVRADYEGQKTVLQYSENPDVEGTYLEDFPYSFTGYIYTNEFYDRIVELSN